MGLAVPQAAGVGADLIGQDDGAVGGLAELQLEVHQSYAALAPEGLQDLVDAEGVLLDEVDLLPGSQLQGQSVILVQQRIVQVVVLIGELDGGLVEHNAFLHAVAGGKVTGGDVADDDLQRHDGDLLHQGLPLT